MNYKHVFIQNSCVHLIIAAYNRKPIFIDNVDLLQKAIINAMQYFQFEIVAFCILSDHIHIIMKPIDIKDGFYDENWCNFGNKNKIKDLNYE